MAIDQCLFFKHPKLIQNHDRSTIQSASPGSERKNTLVQIMKIFTEGITDAASTRELWLIALLCCILYFIMSRSPSQTPATISTDAGEENDRCCNIDVPSNIWAGLNPNFRAQAKVGKGNKNCANIRASHAASIPKDITPVFPSGPREREGKGQWQGGTTSIKDLPPSPPDSPATALYS